MMVLNNGRGSSVKQHILETAVESFLERGFASVSVEEIASRAGVSAAAVKRMFPEKREIVIAAIEETSRQHVESLHDKLVGADDESVTEIVAEHVSHNPLQAMVDILTENRTQDRVADISNRGGAR
jgi:AcrR family transcriptional regulator